jgi:hypothetical protein
VGKSVARAQRPGARGYLPRARRTLAGRQSRPREPAGDEGDECHRALPSELRGVAYHNKRVVYDILMKAAAETTLAIAADPKRLGAKIGITSVLHTWGSALMHHPHQVLNHVFRCMVSVNVTHKSLCATGFSLCWSAGWCMARRVLDFTALPVVTTSVHTCFLVSWLARKDLHP